MKKVFIASFIALFFLTLVACQRRASEVTVLRISGWVPESLYALNTTLDLSNVEIIVSFDGEPDETLPIVDTRISIQGNAVATRNASTLILKTDAPGVYELRISYGSVTLTVQYLVLEADTLNVVAAALDEDATLEAQRFAVDQALRTLSSSENLNLDFVKLDNLSGPNRKPAVLDFIVNMIGSLNEEQLSTLTPQNIADAFNAELAWQDAIETFRLSNVNNDLQVQPFFDAFVAMGTYQGTYQPTGIVILENSTPSLVPFESANEGATVATYAMSQIMALVNAENQLVAFQSLDSSVQYIVIYHLLTLYLDENVGGNGNTIVQDSVSLRAYIYTRSHNLGTRHDRNFILLAMLEGVMTILQNQSS